MSSARLHTSPSIGSRSVSAALDNVAGGGALERLVAAAVADVAARLFGDCSSAEPATASAAVAREVLRHLMAHRHDLPAATAAPPHDPRGYRDGSARTQRLGAMKADIARNLDRSGFSIDALAARHRVSPRYVQMLFGSEGTTFTEFLRDQRLALAHRMLADPRFADRSITSLAFDAGFGDLSYFNRLFRRRFACSPSQVRRAVWRETARSGQRTPAQAQSQTARDGNAGTNGDHHSRNSAHGESSCVS